MIALKPMGTNRTGMAIWPAQGSALIAGANAGHPSSRGDETSLAAIRVIESKESARLGAVPRPITPNAAGAMAEGRKGGLLIDRLGERLAFERAGVRMYEALMAKLRAGGSWNGGPAIRDLTRMRDDELRHFELARRALARLGADSTAMSPSNDLTGVEMAGIFEVLTDPRTTPPQGLHAILIAELVDNEGWACLFELADGLGEGKLANEMRAALAEEQRHLSLVRAWIRSYVMGNGTLELDTRFE